MFIISTLRWHRYRSLIVIRGFDHLIRAYARNTGYGGATCLSLNFPTFIDLILPLNEMCCFLIALLFIIIANFTSYLFSYLSLPGYDACSLRKITRRAIVACLNKMSTDEISRFRRLVRVNIVL